ncbi:dolichol-phosphate mannosyltransferase [Flexibacter flexilis DSM 6793]|uniref:Dolichol-phosphate mannosyltransferase n=1 Tax=Flexibacter flexilis DSM 6793 TaxID=927664 RepID=A0A1I1H432_9BACT|nr:glycosyltransferase family 2 protein [Flexibacter flexilis]SFC18694.1 dolichol-phosphate mannosyltransferase [Flexibacter flexilis DSM 6793]
MYFHNNWAVVIPLANEESEFFDLISFVSTTLDRLASGTVYLVVDKASKDKTLELSQSLSERDSRFITVWSPENKNVVDAYLKGYRVAYDAGHEFIIEMDAGLSHDPRAIPMFLRVLNEGNECAFGSRFINGGSTADSAWKRRFLSKFGTTLANVMLGTHMKDMTSGYQGFHRSIVKKFLEYPLKSKAHFYQTELRYLLRYSRYMEVPIHYRAPSPSVSNKAIKNSIDCLFFYFFKRLNNKPVFLIDKH